MPGSAIYEEIRIDTNKSVDFKKIDQKPLNLRFDKLFLLFLSLFENFSTLKTQKKQVGPIQQKIASILPMKDAILPLTIKLEQTALSFRLKQSFVFGVENKSSDSGVSDISFSLILNGKLDNLLRYLEQLESLPQFVEMSSSEIIKSEKEKLSAEDFEHFESELERSLTRVKIADKWRTRKYRIW